MRLIDVDSLMLREYEFDKLYNTAYVMGHNSVLREVMDAPTIDAKIVIHANIISDGTDLHKCSHCGHLLPYDVNGDMVDFWFCNYCPCCGAKLDRK